MPDAATAREAPQTEPEFLTAEQAGRLLSASAWTIYNLKAKGLLRAYQIAGSTALRFKREDVLALMQEA